MPCEPVQNHHSQGILSASFLEQTSRLFTRSVLEAVWPEVIGPPSKEAKVKPSRTTIDQICLGSFRYVDTLHTYQLSKFHLHSHYHIVLPRRALRTSFPAQSREADSPHYSALLFGFAPHLSCSYIFQLDVEHNQ